jgi:hypothetical protein
MAIVRREDGAPWLGLRRDGGAPVPPAYPAGTAEAAVGRRNHEHSWSSTLVRSDIEPVVVGGARRRREYTTHGYTFRQEST